MVCRRGTVICPLTLLKTFLAEAEKHLTPLSIQEQPKPTEQLTQCGCNMTQLKQDASSDDASFLSLLFITHSTNGRKIELFLTCLS